MKRIPQLDGVRGIAILLVVIWHYYVVPPGNNTGFHSVIKSALRFSWSGVDLFFVLSGFLIGGNLLDNRSAKNLFAVFYYRRFLRIVPLYLIVLIPFILIYSSDMWQAQKGLTWLFKNPMPLWSYAVLIQNFFMIGAQHFGPHWLGISWSLAIEEQFYLVVPCLVSRVSFKKLAYIVIFSSIICRLFFVFLFDSPYAAFLLLPCRMDSLMLGIIAAWMVRQPTILKQIMGNPSILYGAAFVLGVGILALSIFGFGPGSTLFLTIGLTWIGAFYFFFILISLTNKSRLLNKILCSKILRGLGLCSYSIYLFHLVFLGLCHSFILKQIPQNKNLADVGITLLALFLTVAISAISWYMFEKPILNLRHRIKYT